MNRPRFIEHLLSILFVGAIVALIVFLADRNTAARHTPPGEGTEYLSWSFIDFGNPLHKAAFKESLLHFLNNDEARVTAVMAAIEARRQEQFTSDEQKNGSRTMQIQPSTLARIAIMYLQFLLVYFVVMILTYHAAQAIALYRFVRWSHHKEQPADSRHAADRLPERTATTLAMRLLRGTLKAIAYAVLFAPAYVIAYTLRTRFDTASLPFMVALGVVSNGLLITYANKLYTLLVTESRKGYVETALVKNLFSSYAWGTPDGIAHSALFRWRKRFPSHVFDHIYRNAHFQWIPTLKEHGTFLITGLIIIEMALNIQGHLCYELLQTILYRQFALTAIIGLAIFMAVKATEIFVDAWQHREQRRYDNVR